MLLPQVFGGLFNIMLWICVGAELALAVCFDGDDYVHRGGGARVLAPQAAPASTTAHGRRVGPWVALCHHVGHYRCCTSFRSSIISYQDVQHALLQPFPRSWRAREVTPIVLSAVIVMSGLLQWWTELKAEMMMESLQTMSASPKVPPSFSPGVPASCRLQ